MSAGWRTTPLRLATDERHGGRWTSLRTRHREWLWTNPDAEVAAARRTVRPDEPFVDAGGAEECIPTVRGVPDHGAAWSRPWDAGPASVGVPAIGRLSRGVSEDGDGLTVSYTITGTPGTTFLHALHALLDVGPEARLIVPGVRSAVVLDPEEHEVPWPSGLDALGPDDGSAVCAVLPGCSRARVEDGDDALELSWSLDEPVGPVSLILWRNLRGWPQPSPYRSIGIEPLAGAAVDLRSATPDQVAVIGPSGSFGWQVRLTGWRRA